MSKKRYGFIDAAKALGILFIVLGHVLKDGDFRRFIYSFHVPLFFFLSGLTYSTSKSRYDYIKRKFKTLLLPYAVFSMISIAIYQLLAKYVVDGTNSILHGRTTSDGVSTRIRCGEHRRPT